MSKELTLQEVRATAGSITQSGLFGFKNENQAYTLMLIAQSEGLHPMKAMQMYDIINGKPALKSSEVLARFQQSGGSIKWIETNDKIAKGEFAHPQGGSITIEWTFERAVKAGLTNKDNWIKFPNQMLRARVVTEAVRAIYPSCLNNMYSAEEVQDMPIPEKEEVIENAEIEETYNIEVDKKALVIKLKKYDFTNAMMKDFYDKFVNDNVEVLKELLEDDKKLIEKIEEFEK